MADSHEEQLLSELLGDIAREDAPLDAPHLEASVVASACFEVHERRGRSPAWVVLPVAAAVVAAFAMTVTVGNRSDSSVGLKPDTTDMVGLKPDTTTDSATTDTTDTVRPKPDRDAGNPPTHEVSAVDARVDEQSSVTSSIEFVPLMPITENELTGSFQIVRVQMSGASLGALRSPLTQPNEMVEADLLLGEDGRARAIRVNANESIYPWRPR
jgi:hypothetical protein